MEYRSSEVKAGLFILVSLIIFLGFLVVIVGMQSWSEKSIYRARFNYVGGIEKGSLVRFAGLEVGQVKDVLLPAQDDPRVEIVMEIRKDTPIRANSTAYLTTIGIMGAFYVEITTGTADAPLLPDGALIPSKDVTAFAQMSENIDKTTEELTELLKRVNDLFNKENRQNISSMIASMKEMSEQNSKSIQEIVAHLNQMTVHLDETITSVNQLLGRNETTIARSMQNLEQTLEQSRLLVAKLNQGLDELNNSMYKNSSSYEDVLNNLTTISKNLEEFSQQIKERPWSIIRKSHAPERKLP